MPRYHCVIDGKTKRLENDAVYVNDNQRKKRKKFGIWIQGLSHQQWMPQECISKSRRSKFPRNNTFALQNAKIAFENKHVGQTTSRRQWRRGSESPLRFSSQCRYVQRAYALIWTKNGKNLTPSGEEISKSNYCLNQSTNQPSYYSYKCCRLYFQFFPASRTIFFGFAVFVHH